MKNESHIISRMISGDINAFKLLFDRYYSQVRFFTLGIVKDSFVADECIYQGLDKKRID